MRMSADESMIEMEMGGITEDEMDWLMKSAPPGIIAKKTMLHALSATTDSVFWGGVISFSADLAKDVIGPLLIIWILSLKNKRKSELGPEGTSTISIEHTEIDLREGEVTRIIFEKVHKHNAGNQTNKPTE